jgi:hypothetical protein
LREEAPEKPDRVAPDRFCDRDTLDHINPALAAFDLCHERLRLSELVCELLLDDTRVLPRGLQQGEKTSVIG